MRTRSIQREVAELMSPTHLCYFATVFLYAYLLTGGATEPGIHTEPSLR